MSMSGMSVNPFAEKKTGYLVKQSKDKIRKTWSKRYFELEWPHLRYKKDPAETEWRGVLDCTDVTLSDELGGGVEREYAFGAYHKDREAFFLQAENLEEMMQWVNAIRKDSSSKQAPLICLLRSALRPHTRQRRWQHNTTPADRVCCPRRGWADRFRRAGNARRGRVRRCAARPPPLNGLDVRDEDSVEGGDAGGQRG